jgi:hypothetical protein
MKNNNNNNNVRLLNLRGALNLRKEERKMLKFKLTIRGMIGCSGYMGGQDQDLRLIGDNKMC